MINKVGFAGTVSSWEIGNKRQIDKIEITTQPEGNKLNKLGCWQMATQGDIVKTQQGNNFYIITGPKNNDTMPAFSLSSNAQTSLSLDSSNYKFVAEQHIKC